MSRSLDSYQPERLILKVTLLGGDPKIWRRVDVDGGITLHDLHYVIQCKQIAQVNYYPRQESNVPANHAEKQSLSPERGTESGTPGGDLGQNRPDEPSPLPPDLAGIVNAWPNLPPVVKAGILAMVKAASR